MVDLTMAIVESLLLVASSFCNKHKYYLEERILQASRRLPDKRHKIKVILMKEKEIQNTNSKI
jgi:hypothetical protein